ncbi:MAG TPA: hypothetical protein PK668_17040 [Myxococcota bacterium]|nr:hypothetical protein [Myxococcota bacterium]HRY94866.1 hypothetical protein [Myxococcota bacterium]HSA23166.1 hypothetical protein [Myxococcota bacterium]
MGQVNARRFPTVARYLDLHCGRLDRHPGCQVKTGLLRDVIEGHPLERVERDLPAEVVELLRSPPPVNVWMPEMLIEAVLQACADEHFASQAEAEEWAFRHDLERFRGPLYRLLMVLARPESMLRAASKRWEAFHRGSSLEVEVQPNRVVGTLRFPPWLYMPEARINLAGPFRAALVAAGAEDARVLLIEAGELVQRYEATWS